MEGHVSDRPHEPIVSTGSDRIKAVLAASIKPGSAPQTEDAMYCKHCGQQHDSTSVHCVPQLAMTDHERRAEHITGACRCHDGYKCRKLIDPDCTYHGYAEDIQQALTQAHAAGRREGMERAAKLVERWHISKGGYSEMAWQIRDKAKEAGHE